MNRSRLLKAVIAVLGCGVVAVIVGISTSDAATSHRGAHAGAWLRHGPTGPTGPTGPRGLRGFGGGFGGRRLVIHSVTVVPNSSGTFDTVTIDGGTLKTISGDELTITEGTKSATYATPTITVASGAKVVLDGEASALTALVAGDRVTIAQNSDGKTTVVATDSSFKPRFGPGIGGRFGGWGRGGPPHGGPTGPTGVWRSGRPARGLFG